MESTLDVRRAPAAALDARATRGEDEHSKLGKEGRRERVDLCNSRDANLLLYEVRAGGE